MIEPWTRYPDSSLLSAQHRTPGASQPTLIPPPEDAVLPIGVQASASGDERLTAGPASVRSAVDWSSPSRWRIVHAKARIAVVAAAAVATAAIFPQNGHAAHQ